MAAPLIPRIIKVADWPPQDRRLWERGFSRRRLFDIDSGVFAAWSDGTRRIHAQGYGSWLSFILRCHPHLREIDPAGRVTRELVELFVEEGRERLKLRSIANQLMSLAAVIGGFSPNCDVRWLWRASDELTRRSESQHLKPPLPVTAATLFQWSLGRLAETVDDKSLSARTAAATFRDALMVGLLISCPVRARAFMAMTVSRHVDIAAGQAMLVFGAEVMKDRKDRRLPVPIAIAPFLLEYIDHYRPVLLDGRHSDALWISRRGNVIAQDTFTTTLANLTRRSFGHALRPHAFRHIAATSIAIVDPVHSGIIRDVLGHATVRMAEMHYNRATAWEATQRLQNILRGKGKRQAKTAVRRRQNIGVEEQDW